MTAPGADLIDEVCRRVREVPGDVTEVVHATIDTVAPLLDNEQRAEAARRCVARLSGLDTLEHLLRDPGVDEVMVNRGREIWVDRQGELRAVGELPHGAIEVILERVLAFTGQRLDRTQPIVDARLPDGSRLCAVVDPVACDGPSVAIRRHRDVKVPLTMFGDEHLAELLVGALAARCNIVVTGATSSGKTTLLRTLLDHVATDERLVTIEDTAELVPDTGRHVVRLEARRSSADGGVDVDLARLVRTALRLRPDRLIVGEFRGSEVVAVVEALNTGHDGSMSTCHANSAIDGLRRIETLVMQSAAHWPLAAIRRQLTRSIDLIVHLQRDHRGRRQIVEVLEVLEGDSEPTGNRLVKAGSVVGELERRRA